MEPATFESFTNFFFLKEKKKVKARLYYSDMLMNKKLSLRKRILGFPKVSLVVICVYTTFF